MSHAERTGEGMAGYQDLYAIKVFGVYNVRTRHCLYFMNKE